MKKLVQVVMLPTEKADSKIRQHKNLLQFNDQFLTSMYRKEEGIQMYELYLTSDDPIKKHDWFLANGCILRQCESISLDALGTHIIDTEGGRHAGTVCNKVIAATDNLQVLEDGAEEFFGTHRIPDLSDDFLKAYVKKGDHIKEVLVEYTEIYDDNELTRNVVGHALNLRTDNTVIVSPAKVYPEKTVKKALRDGIDFGLSKMGVLTGNKENEFIQKWLEQNG